MTTPRAPAAQARAWAGTHSCVSEVAQLAPGLEHQSRAPTDLLQRMLQSEHKMSPSGQLNSPSNHISSKDPRGDHAEEICVATSCSPPAALPAAGVGTQTQYPFYPPTAHKLLSYLYDPERLQKICVKKYCLLPVSTHSLLRFIECPLVAA